MAAVASHVSVLRGTPSALNSGGSVHSILDGFVVLLGAGILGNLPVFVVSAVICIAS